MSGWFLVAAAVAIVLLVLAGGWFRRFRSLRGFEDARADISQFVARLSGGTLGRESGDLVLKGRYKGIPLTVRFSRSEYSPGLYMTCPAPVNLALSFAPKNREVPGGQIVFRTGDPVLDRQFVGRTNQLTYAKLFLGLSQVVSEVRKLCSSSGAMLMLGEYKFEFFEDLIPSDTLNHLVVCADSLTNLSRALEKMPGARVVGKGAGARGDNRLLIGLGTAAVLGLVLLAVLFLRGTPAAVNANRGVAEQPVAVPNGMSADDARLVRDLSGWKLFQPAGDPEFASWADRFGLKTASRLQLDAQGTGEPGSTAYVLSSERDPRMKRLVWIVNHRVMCDLIVNAEGVASIPKWDIGRISPPQEGEPGVNADGDGLLLVRDRSKADMTLIFVANNELHSKSVSDFHP